jgi:hypothetical protein
MCNFIPLRNFLISLGILAGFAATSAMFAMLWQKNGGFPLVTTISFSAAATWALSALMVLYFTMSALTTFCTCAARVAACAAACSAIRPLLLTLTGLLVALFAGCTVEAGDWTGLDWEIWGGLILASSGTLVIIGTIAYYGASLGRCQGP